MTKLPLFFSQPDAAPGLPRRAFLRYAGAASAGAALLLAGCKKDDDPAVAPTANSNGESVSLGGGDVQFINLLQAGKQISAELLKRVVATPPAGLSATDLALVSAMAEQQKVHRDVLKLVANATRTSGSATLNLPELPVDFSALTLTERTAALNAALTLLNTLVAGAAGALRYTSRSTILTILGQIMSVDARHVATFALIAGVAHTDPLDAVATDVRNRSLRPSETASALNAYIASGSRLLTGSLA